MPQYIDGFVLPLPKKNLKSYKKMAETAAKVWMEHGALAYYECVGEDLDVSEAAVVVAVERKLHL